MASILGENMLGYLSLNIIFVAHSLRSRKTVRFSEQIMSADKYPSIFSSQMEAIFYLVYTTQVNNYFPCTLIGQLGGDQPRTVHLRAAEEKRNGFCRCIVTLKVTLWSDSYSACVVYAETIIHIYLEMSTSPPCSSLNIHHDSLSLR